MALLSVETVEHEKLSPQATGTQESQRGRVCSVWPHGATGEASSFRELGQHAEQTHSEELLSIAATGQPQQHWQGVHSINRRLDCTESFLATFC